MEEWTNKFFQEVWKDCAISIQQKCKLHKPGRPNINFDEIALNFENHVPNTTSIQLFNCFQTFPQLKIIFFRLEISERLGNCKLCFLSNEIRANVNANSWIGNERNSSVEFFLLILVSSSSISLWRHISSISCQLKPFFTSKSYLENTTFWLDHPLATLPRKPEQALRDKLRRLVFT